MVSAKKTCGKTRFISEIEAAKWLKRMTQYVTNNGNTIGHIPCRTYECMICSGYHVTSRK